MPSALWGGRGLAHNEFSYPMTLVFKLIENVGVQLEREGEAVLISRLIKLIYKQLDMSRCCGKKQGSRELKSIMHLFIL